MEKISLFGFDEEENTKPKIAVLKLGARISISSTGTSGGTGEALSIVNILNKAGYDVYVYTKVLKGDVVPDTFSIFNIETEYLNINSRDYKALIVVNGNVNYFGGQDVPSQTLNYYIINNFKGKVFYIICDCKLFLKQIWPSVSKKKFNYLEKDINIVRDDIVYISQPRDVIKTLDMARRYVNIKDCIHFPFEKFPMLDNNYFSFNENTKYDLLYGGTFRGGSREDDMIKFYFGYPEEYNVSMFGNIDLGNFSESKINGLRSPNFEKPISYDRFIEKMNESKATVIIGDKIYKELDDLAQRIYESLLSSIVVLIDSSYDYNKRVFNNDELRNFCYVSSREDVIDRLNKIKDIEFRRHIVELQKSDINFSSDDYCNVLKSIVEG